MLELSMHILDIVENSTRAGAKLIKISIIEDIKKDIFSIEIIDDGTGMSEDTLRKTLDPFFTTKDVREIGLGLPMLSHSAKSTEGNFTIESKEGEGTRVAAEYKHGHIDRQPLGNITGTLITLITGNPEVDFVYCHRNGAETYTLDTRDIKKELEGIPINNTEVLKLIRGNIEEGLEEIGIKNNG